MRAARANSDPLQYNAVGTTINAARDTKLLITLGPGLTPASHGDVVVLDWGTKGIVDQFRYTQQVYDISHKGLAGATWHGEQLLVALEAELLQLEVAPLRLVAARTFPFLNDVHHLCANGDRIWICNTGTDCVEELDANWQWIETHDLVRRFAPDPIEVIRFLHLDFKKSFRRMRGWYDHYTHLTRRPPFRNVVKLLFHKAYRRNGKDLRFSDFRPHWIHPNHLLPMEDDLWITHWQTGQVVSLRRGEVLAKNLGSPHDGIVDGDEYFITDCNTNRVIVCQFDAAAPAPGARIREGVVTSSLQEGFLRGVAAVGDRLFVGLTARRASPARWQRARVVALDRQTLKPLEDWVVPDRFGNGLFSILDATAAY